MGDHTSSTVRVLCRKLVLSNTTEPCLQWLIGSPFFPQYTVVSTVRCIHHQPADPLSPDYTKESEDLRSLIIKGFHIIGALIVGINGTNMEQLATEAIRAARKIRECLRNDFTGDDVEFDLIGGVVNSSDVKFFLSRSGIPGKLQRLESVMYEEEPEKFVWERGCLLRCELPIKLPVYAPGNKNSDIQRAYLDGHETFIAKFKDTQLVYILQALRSTSTEPHHSSIVIRGVELDFKADLSNVKHLEDMSEQSDAKSLPCSFFFPANKPFSPASYSVENADIIQVTLLSNRSVKSPKSVAPAAEYCPAPEETKLLVVDYNLEVLCYTAKHLPLSYAVSKLIIPALTDQLNSMKNADLPFLGHDHQLHPYHFGPPGVLHPITVIYELSYGETEIKQVELRRLLHLRLGLPSDRPLLRAANAMNFSHTTTAAKGLGKRGSTLLKDVHTGIPSSGVSGGLVALVQGSYEYHHYLQDGFDDSGWGCAYRSLQTIISWFRLQHYTSIDVPTHREIQQALVEIGDKDPSFVGSRDWIGAIELSYVLDKLLGVTCKVMNVRSGAELPEKCRELAMHFENQGTPIMIGGGVLAYTLLGVDYSDVSGDCAFLILDPHYTGGDDLKKIVNSGWCGWKKAVDGKGKHFFLHDKFYNLLLPQRPNMV